MKINRDRQQEAQEKAKELLASQEQKRAETRLLKLEQALEQGKSEALLNNEFMENLPALIAAYSDNNEQDRIRVLIDKIGECTCCEGVKLLGECDCSEDAKLRERAVMALSLCMDGLSREEYPDLLKHINTILLQWLRVETTFLSVCTPICKQLQEYGIRLLEEGLWKECDSLLDLFYKIQSGELEKSNAIRSVVSRAQEAMAADHIIEELTLVSLRGKGERKAIAEQTLLHLGRKAAIHLLDTLISSQEKEERLRLVALIPATGYVSVSVLKDYLQKRLPWYAIRNIVLIIEALGDQELLPQVSPFLDHEDVRVQQQVLDCIYAIGEDNKGRYLLNALKQVDDALKPSLIAYLGKTAEPGAMEIFLDLLTQRDQFSSHVRNELLQTLAVQLRLCDSVRAVNLLNMIIEERREDHGEDPDPVTSVALQSLHILKHRFNVEEIQGDQGELPSDENLDNVSFDGDPTTLDIAKREVQKINDQVASLLGENKVSDASQLLYEKCVEAAMMKDFNVAEILIDRILEVDPNAVAQLIRAGERIEEEKSSAVSSNHISIWQDLYDSLTTEEFNGLYYALKQKHYSTESVIVEQGTSRPALYFINSGQAKLSWQRDQDEIFLKRINPGEVIGRTPFFDVSVWTVSLTALGKVDLHILERETFLELIEEFPRLEHCLVEYCQKNEPVSHLIKMSGEDRRQAVRYPISHIVNHALIDENGEVSTRNFKGEIADISSGGLSFYIRISRQENARLLLGRNIQTYIAVDDVQMITCRGQIVAVRSLQNIDRDYSVHIQFEKSLADDIVRSIASKWPGK